MANLTDREMSMLLGLLEAEVEKARLIEQKWRDTPEEGYEDGPEALRDEQGFATGVAHGWDAAATLIKNVMNA